MKIKESHSSIEVIGDIEEIKTSIDPRNLEFITTLLSSNLYSNPEQSFIREIVSNAWDSQVEAGTTNTPVIISLDSDSTSHSITIRDYGTGLSPERFNDIYRNIGSSTKRESNNYIGAFGIGHLSPFACSSTVYITSYYKGTAYHYIGNKLNNEITYHKVAEVPTKEENGVEVTIKNITNVIPYKKALSYITFFPNVYVNGFDNCNFLNSIKIKHFDNFAVSSAITYHKLLLGNVLYPIDKNLFNAECNQFLDSILNTGIVIKFNIGELDITPNREAIIYNSNTIKIITNRILEAKKEIDDITSKIPNDYNNIVDYYNAIITAKAYDFISNSITTDTLNNYKLYPLQSNAKYKGKLLIPSLNQCIKLICGSMIPYRGVIYDNKLYTRKPPYGVRYRVRVVSKLLKLSEKTRLTKVVLSYIKTKYEECVIISDINEDDFIQFINNNVISTSLNNKDREEINSIIKDIYTETIAKADILDITSDREFLEYKKNYSKLPKKDIKEEYTILYITERPFNSSRKVRFNNFESAIKYIKTLHQGVILDYLYSDNSVLDTLAGFKKAICIRAKKSTINRIKELNLSCVIDSDWLLYKDPLLSKVKTITTYFPRLCNLHTIYHINTTIDKELGDAFITMYNIKEKLGSNTDYLGFACVDTIPEDSYIKYLCDKLNYYSSKLDEIKSIVSTQNEYAQIPYNQCITIIEALIIKSKAYRVRYDVYKRFKDNKIFKILCKK